MDRKTHLGVLLLVHGDGHAQGEGGLRRVVAQLGGRVLGWKKQCQGEKITQSCCNGNANDAQAAQLGGCVLGCTVYGAAN